MARSVFITGAAAGIGRQTALAFAAKGYTVGAYDLDTDGLSTLAEQIQTMGATVFTGHLDVTDTAEMSMRISEFASACGNRLDVLINNAGILYAGRFEDIDITDHLGEIDVNCKGAVNALHAAFPYLRTTPQSVVVNLSSASAIYGQPELAVYSSTKFFIRGLTEALDIEWARHDIRVISMWPLFVQTAMTDGVDTGSTRTLGIHLGPHDVADAIIEAVEPPRTTLQRAVHQVHFPVGSTTKAMTLASRFTPAWLNRQLAKRVARS